jgi:ribosomal protein S18 acetylase RimI-like enzyme
MPRIVNCLCGQLIEAPGVEELVAAYREHNATQHGNLKIPEARSAQLDAAIRRTGGWDGTREQIGSAVEVWPLTPDLKDAYLAYFDGPALCDNPPWANCYCLSYHLNSAPAGFDSRPVERNRADRAAQIERGDASGVLAFSEGRIVGWCNASPRRSLPQLDRTPLFASDEPDSTAAIVCYVIAPHYRGQGIARRLLDGAVDTMRQRGFRSLEAYPPKRAATDAASYHGKLGMYLDAGFEQVREDERYAVVRKTL